MDCIQGLRKCFLLQDINDTLMCVQTEINYASLLINFSDVEALKVIYDHQFHDRNLSPTAEKILIFIYVLLMVSGLSANLVVSFVVARKTQMHTPRNLYIVNLTVSDMTLCVVCMPFTLVSVLQRHWDMGVALCKLVPALQGSNIFVSVGTITVIAFDRYLTIVRGQEVQNTRRRVLTSLVIIWVVSALVTTPLFYYQAVVPVTLHRLVLYEKCMEVWPTLDLKVTYTAIILLFAAVIPVVVVATIHMRIATHLYLQARMRSHQDERWVQREIGRNRRTTLLLSMVAIMFALSWLPLSFYSLIADVFYPAEYPPTVSPQDLYVSFAICHIIAMTSATSNPVIYGWLNSNIRQEFLHLLQTKCTTSSKEPTKTTRAQQTLCPPAGNEFQEGVVLEEGGYVNNYTQSYV